MHLSRSNLLRFYDDRRTWLTDGEHRGAHVSAITAILGEDLVMALLLHHWRSEGHDGFIASYRCNQGKTGSRLDAWILQDSVRLFQVEVKNWSAHSLGGKDLHLEASEAERAKVAQARWRHYFLGESGLAPEVKKVLTPMNRPEHLASLPVSKLLCFWSYVVNASGDPYSVVIVNGEELHVFSASAYLRRLTIEAIPLEMPRASDRLRLIQTLHHPEDA